jgi:lipoprotein NlpD
MTRVVVVLFALLLTACETNPPAPVIERASTNKPKPPEAKPVDAKTAATKDWRPDSHVVKKGDTLFGIGLEYGIDYKEIAAANNIIAPYQIKIGQTIDLRSFKTKAAVPAETTKTEDGVVISPIKTEPTVTGQETSKPVVSAVTPVLSEPKAVREPYSLEALNRTNAKPIASKPTETKPTDAKPIEAKPADSNASGDDESITWTWPTQGKVSARFNEVSNKGIDIAGSTGQAINAASAGKVIYSGSDLRGYGKLVIIKHNKTYLSVYAHNSKIVAKEGQAVAAGQKIAEMGNTDSNSVKLHFEIRRLGKSVDPARYLSQN